MFCYFKYEFFFLKFNHNSYIKDTCRENTLFLIYDMEKENNIVKEALEKLSPSKKLLVRDKLIIATKINERLRELGICGMSMYLSRELNLNRSDCQDILSGDYNYTLDLLAKLEQLLDINFFEL